MKIMRLVAAAAAASAAASAAAPALAQDADDGVRIVTIGAGVQATPRYPGARDSRLGPLPRLTIDRPGEPARFRAPDQGIGFGLLGRHSAIDIGPAVQLRYSRRSGRDVPAGIPSVGFTVEAGGFVQAMLGDSFRVRAEGRQGIGGHKGAVLDLSADAILRTAGDTTLFSIGPRLRLSDGRYQRAYFGVSLPAAIATGLPAYTPGAGVHAAGVSSGITQKLGGAWGLYAYGGYDRLIGDAGRSPLVRRYGRRDELSGGLALTYSFHARLPGL
ncbi:MAG TPA: MipA/OmpV family protein [Allosphingosinicella sp.]|nr:MipA/OmpV family protein [Allosphingosinicella sp.]